MFSFSFSFLTLSVLDFKFEAMETQKNLGVALLPHHVPGGKVLRHWDLQQPFELADRDQRVAQFPNHAQFAGGNESADRRLRNAENFCGLLDFVSHAEAVRIGLICFHRGSMTFPVIVVNTVL